MPLLTPYLSSLWLGLTTPLYARVGRKLIESVRNPTVVTDRLALELFPDIRPMGLARAIERARRNQDQELAATDIFLWSRIFELLGDLSDHANRTCDWMRRMLAK